MVSFLSYYKLLFYSWCNKYSLLQNPLSYPMLIYAGWTFRDYFFSVIIQSKKDKKKGRAKASWGIFNFTFIDGSRGRPWHIPLPPSDQIIIDFMQFLGTFNKILSWRTLLGLAPLLQNAGSATDFCCLYCQICVIAHKIRMDMFPTIIMTTCCIIDWSKKS